MKRRLLNDRDRYGQEETDLARLEFNHEEGLDRRGMWGLRGFAKISPGDRTFRRLNRRRRLARKHRANRSHR